MIKYTFLFLALIGSIKSNSQEVSFFELYTLTMLKDPKVAATGLKTLGYTYDRQSYDPKKQANCDHWYYNDKTGSKYRNEIDFYYSGKTTVAIIFTSWDEKYYKPIVDTIKTRYIGQYNKAIRAMVYDGYPRGVITYDKDGFYLVEIDNVDWVNSIRNQKK